MIAYDKLKGFHGARLRAPIRKNFECMCLGDLPCEGEKSKVRQLLGFGLIGPWGAMTLISVLVDGYNHFTFVHDVLMWVLPSSS